MPLLVLAGALAIGACGGDDDTGAPDGTFEAEIRTPQFPVQQRLAETVLLRIGVENVGAETIPELAFTVTTEEQGAEEAALADGPFRIRLTGEEAADLSNPNRSVWQLEEGFPMLAEQFRQLRRLERIDDDDPRPDIPIEEQPPQTSPGLRVQTNTFGFGPLEPGDTREIVWRLSPTRAGTYILSYEVAADLEGRAQLTSPVGEVSGNFIVTISDVPRRARVGEGGEVIAEEDEDEGMGGEANGGSDSG